MWKMTRQQRNGEDHSSQLEIKSPPLDKKKRLGSRLRSRVKQQPRVRSRGRPRGQQHKKEKG
jgi:hypothetical protein